MDLSLQHLLLTFAAYTVAVASPGPSTVRIMAASMLHGRRAGLTLAAGVVSGSLFWGICAAMGVSAVLTRYAEALVALKIAGGLYLLWLAVKSARSAWRGGESSSRAPRPTPSAGVLYRQGLFLHLANPKAVLGWIALVALGLGPEARAADVAVILAGCAVLSVLLFGGYALAFSSAPMQRLYARARRWIEGTLAVVFGAAGIKLLTVRV